ncbi:MAG: multicopper oxidase family protein [Culicoidibacterales bacterium]
MTNKIKIIAGIVVALSVVIGGTTFISYRNEVKVVNQLQNLTSKNPYTIEGDINEGDKKYELDIAKMKMSLNGETFDRYVYTDEQKTEYPGGKPIIINAGDNLTIMVKNSTDVDTNIHWHGMSVPNDQDGPGILIKPGGTHEYQFKAEKAGTYWYHSHERPVRDQVDEGMYGAIIVRAKEDKEYSRDQILLIDDWTVKNETGHMEIIGDVDTVNGKTGNEITPIEIKGGELNKLRFIGASTAKVHDLKFPVPVRVTHTDGAPLVSPYMTTSLTLSPGERYDVELSASDISGEQLAITNDRKKGLSIPISYSAANQTQKQSPYIAPQGTTLDAVMRDKQPDILMSLGDGMGKAGMLWTINGEIFPDVEQFSMDLGKTYKMRFSNDGRHKMGHPMHVHGAHFRVVSKNGTAVPDEIWKDTIDIPTGEYIDVVVTFDKAGTWMVHCHILDHEDGGMMTSIKVE